MAFFGRKKNPLRDRENNLNAEIAGLEDQIRHLKTALGQTGGGESGPAEQGAGKPPGTLRRPAPEPVFEKVDQAALQDTHASNPFSSRADNRSIHEEGTVSFWEKLNRFFRGPKSSNPKLVSYLAAGNIHGLRPLRYEKRIHRNRTLLWVGILLVALVGLLKMLIR